MIIKNLNSFITLENDMLFYVQNEDFTSALGYFLYKDSALSLAKKYYSRRF